jgi:hypothetical protein
MKGSRSSINYIKAEKENYKASATRTNTQPIDFNFAEREVDRNLYCFFTQTKAPKYTKNIDTGSNQIQKPTLVKKLTTSAPKLNQQKIPMHTNITTIKLFDKNDILNHQKIKAPAQQKLMLTITDKISAFFSKPMTSLFK